MKSAALFIASLLLSTPGIGLDADDLDRAIAEGEFKKLSSVLVSTEGRLVFDRYYNGADRQTKHDIRSASKSFTAMAFGLAMDDQVISGPDARVLPFFSDYMPVAYPFEAKANMTFDQLMSMTGPLECNDWNQFSEGNEERMYLRSDWIRFMLDLPERGLPPWEPKLADRPFGNAYSYCTGRAFLTGAAIERATGKSLDDYFYQRILKPMGLSEPVWPESPKGRVQGGGGVRIDSQSLIAIGELILNMGRYEDNQLLSGDWVTTMLTARSQALPDRNFDYGHLWWLFRFEVDGDIHEGWAATGNGGNNLVVFPHLKSVVVMTATAYNTDYMHEQAQRLIGQEILPLLLHQNR